MGTYYNARVLEWFEWGRTELCRTLGKPYRQWEEDGVRVPLMTAHVEYQDKAQYDDELKMTTTAAMAGRARLRSTSSWQTPKPPPPVCQGYTIHAITDLSGRPIRPPAWLLALMEPTVTKPESVLLDSDTATKPRRVLLGGNEAVALAARHFGVALGTGYPGTPSTEIIEDFSELGGRGQWAPNEKVALEVGLGVAFGGARRLVTMKHVGLNVAADVLFTAAYTGMTGPLVVVSADDPGMASSQNEQDNRRYAVAAGVPMLEPADSQEAYDFTLRALEISDAGRCRSCCG